MSITITSDELSHLKAFQTIAAQARVKVSLQQFHAEESEKELNNYLTNLVISKDGDPQKAYILNEETLELVEQEEKTEGQEQSEDQPSVSESTNEVPHSHN
tara:strand:+ start:24 stop:326 length:303 start_codon:yes stop_codon:yes gene_type:complete